MVLGLITAQVVHNIVGIFSSDGAQIVAVAKEQLASFQNAVGGAVTRMHGLQLVAELA